MLFSESSIVVLLPTLGATPPPLPFHVSGWVSMLGFWLEMVVGVGMGMGLTVVESAVAVIAEAAS